MTLEEKNLVSFYFIKIFKSLKYFEYTYNRIKNLSTNITELSDSEFETWDSFSTRFSRTTDIFLSKYVKAYVQQDDPAFDGSFRDFLNRAEKLKLIESTIPWIEIRSLRNVVVHEYSDSDLENILTKMRSLSGYILDLRKIPSK